MSLEEQSSSTTLSSTEPRRKRAKIVSACAECRRKKTKCNGESPCRNCEKSGVQCVYPSSSSQDDKRNAPSKQALEAIEDRLKSIEDMLRAIIKSQNISPELDPVVHQFLNSNSSSSSSPSPVPQPSPPMNRLPSIRSLSTYGNQKSELPPPLGFQNYSPQPDSANIDFIKKRKR